MIKIQRISAPSELTPTVVNEKTAQFKADSTRKVWKESYIESRLMEMSYGKCCYCECRLGEESNYMEVEHFHHKRDYPEEVVIWDNLLPSCRFCNGRKGTHDTIVDPIVNPTRDEPKDHLGFRSYGYRGKTDVGKETVVTLHLNDTEKRCMPRFRVCAELNRKVEAFLADVQSLPLASRPQDKNRIKNNVLELLEVCQCDRPYTAIKATEMIHNDDYDTLVSEMQSRGLWTQDMADLDSRMRGYGLDMI